MLPPAMTSTNFQIIYGLTVLQKGLKIGPSDCIQMCKTSELPRGSAPGPHQEPYGGSLDPTPIYAPLA